MRNFTNYLYAFIPSFFGVLLSKYAKVLLALCILINITGNAAAQAYKMDFNNYKPVSFKAVSDNTREALPHKAIAELKLKAAGAQKKQVNNTDFNNPQPQN